MRASGPGMAEALQRLRDMPDSLLAIARPERLKPALERSMPELTATGAVVERVEPRRLRLKDGACTCRYDLTLEGADGERTVLRLAGVQDLRRLAEPGGAPPGVALGEEGWRRAVPELGLVLGRPSDTALPAVPILTDPARAAALLEKILRAAPARAGLHIEGCTPTVARYKPGSRCTVVYRLRYGKGARGRGWPEAVVAKTHEGDAGRRAYEAMRELWRSELQRSTAVTVAEPLGFLPELNVLVQSAIPAEGTLRTLLRRALARDAADMERVRHLFAKTARGLAAFHRCGLPGAVRTWERDLAEVRKRIVELTHWAPGLDTALEPSLSGLQALAAEHPPEEPACAHGSFRPTQVLVHEGGVAFIDTDGLCTAEPAMDLARFRVTTKHIVIHEPSQSELVERATEAERLCDLFLNHYENERVAPISRERLALWETVYLLKHAVNSWRKIKPETLDGDLFLLDRHLERTGLARALC